ncbi:MAG TPA: S8 family serine peptidase [Solirubrobacterales bacterium]|nr:S8 family serine peptidase [Solirubrobacterales bacterium]
MTLGFGSRCRQARGASLAALLVACALTPASASAMPAASGNPNLSPRLAELTEPALRSAPRAEQAARLSLAPRGPGSLLRDGNRLLVDVRFERGAAAALDALEAAGAEIVHLSHRYQTVTVAARPASLAAIGDVARVGGVTEVLAPIVRGADCGGKVRSEGDVQLAAASARAGFGIDGTGVTVGILSDSYDRNPAAATHASNDVLSGDLPGPGSPCGSTLPVGIVDDSEGEGSDEGRAMAQIVHDLAPGAALSFATAFTGEFSFAANIRALAARGARVITDDVAYFQEPFFQDGPVAVAVNDVAAAGASYFSAAGNDNLIDAEGRDIASWEAPEFRDSGVCPPAIVELSEEIEAEEVKEAEEEAQIPAPVGLHPEHCMDFDPDELEKDETFGITVEAGDELTVDLQWAEPWNGVGTDLDVFLLDDEDKLVEVGGSPVASTSDNVGGTQRPFEFLSWENEGPEQEVRLVVNRFDGSLPRLKVALLENGRGVSATEYPESTAGDIVGPTIFGHAGAAGAIAVGAVPYNDSAKPERYSSRGPVKHFFGPVTGPGPAAPLVQTISKPDLAATDCGVTTFFAFFRKSEGVWRFCGTSAAAPHAAAVAALVRQANPGAGAAQIRAQLAATARPVGAFGPTAVGAGLIDANAAVRSLALPPTIAITKGPEPLSRNRQPTIEFTANRPVAFSCQVDGGQPQPCASPFVVPAPLADGTHGIAVSGVDLAGRQASSGSVFFEIDTTPPQTSIVKHPPKRISTLRKKVRGVFRFGSDEQGATFVCKVDRGLLRVCNSRIVRRFGAGKHVVQVRARDRVGNVDPTPAVFRFRVERSS